MGEKEIGTDEHVDAVVEFEFPDQNTSVSNLLIPADLEARNGRAPELRFIGSDPQHCACRLYARSLGCDAHSSSRGEREYGYGGAGIEANADFASVHIRQADWQRVGQLRCIEREDSDTLGRICPVGKRATSTLAGLG